MPKPDDKVDEVRQVAREQRKTELESKIVELRQRLGRLPVARSKNSSMKWKIGCLATVAIVIFAIILLRKPLMDWSNWLVWRPIPQTFNWPEESMKTALQARLGVSMSDFSSPVHLTNAEHKRVGMGTDYRWYELETNGDEFLKIVLEKSPTNDARKLTRRKWNQIDELWQRGRPNWWPKPADNVEVICITQGDCMTLFYTSPNRIYLMDGVLD